MQNQRGSVSFRRFFIEGGCPGELNEDWAEAFRRYAFGTGGAVTSDGIETGWIVPEHLFDTDFSNTSRISLGCFVHVGLRIDRTAPPANVIRSYRRMEEATALAASGREFLSRQERKLAHEAAAKRAESEVRQGAFRRIVAYSVLFDLEEKAVYLANHGTTAMDKLLALVRDSLDLSLVPADAEATAYRVAQLHGTQRAFEDVEPAMFVEPSALGDALSAPAFDRKHLGWEFFTWLWFRVHHGEGLFESEGRKYAASICRSLRLDCAFDATGTVTIRNDSPSASPEALAAVSIGKTPRKMSLLLAADGGEWSFTFDAQSFAVGGLSYPPLEDADAVAAAEHRFVNMREVSHAIDGLYASFLRIRLSSAWAKELAAIRHWVGELSAARPRRASA